MFSTGEFQQNKDRLHVCTYMEQTSLTMKKKHVEQVHYYLVLKFGTLHKS